MLTFSAILKAARHEAIYGDGRVRRPRLTPAPLEAKARPGDVVRRWDEAKCAFVYETIK